MNANNNFVLIVSFSQELKFIFFGIFAGILGIFRWYDLVTKFVKVFVSWIL